MIYLDNAATSFPKPFKVCEAVNECMSNYAANPGRGSHDMALRSASKVSECRKLVCELFNIPNELRVVFTSNATEGLNIGIKGVLKKGDHVISTIIEHNSVLRPLHHIAKKGVELTLISVNREGLIDINDLRREIKNNTKAIIINHASNVIGSIQNINEIGEIARSRDIIFIVDASQSAGSISIDVISDNIDILALPGHKGLLGPQGTGIVYIREGIEVDEFKLGGTGSKSHSMEQPDFLPDKFESGTLNTPGIAGLCEGIKFIMETGIDNIRKKEEELMANLIDGLKKIDYVKIYGAAAAEKVGAVVSINIGNFDSAQSGYLFNKAGIAVRTGFHCAPLIHSHINTNKFGTVRISPGYFNSHQDIEEVIKVIKSMKNVSE